MGRYLLKRVLLTLRNPDSSLFAALNPLPEREFVAELRQVVLAIVEQDGASSEAAIPLDLETLSSASAPFSTTEKQAVWLEAMRYDPEPSAHMLHMHAGTVEKIREQAAEALRGKSDAWRRSMIADNGPVLRMLAVQSRTEQCCPARIFFDLLDGRITWQQREDIDRHLAGCWYCIDLFCRLREVQTLVHNREPLSPEQAEPFRSLLGIRRDETLSFWKRIMGRR